MGKSDDELNEKLNLMQTRLDDHITDFTLHEKDERERWDHLIRITEGNATAVHDLTAATRDVIAAWQTSINVGKFLKYISSFALLGAMVVWFVEHFRW